MHKAPDRPPAHAASPSPAASTVSDETRRFFRRCDWIAAAVAAAVSLAVYIYTLAPTVTLQDSGEFITASYNLGVPHPPGYPLWTILTWLFTKIPISNIAWRVNLFSAVIGAITNGLVALLISRSGASFLEALKQFTEPLAPRTRDLICQAAGVSGGLILAFSDVMWSQAVIAEVYTLNAFFLVILMLMMFIWIHKPKDLRYLYWAMFWFGMGLTNHHTLIVIFFTFAVMVFLANRSFFLNFLISNMIIGGSIVAELAFLSNDEQLHTIAIRLTNVFAILICLMTIAEAIYLRRIDWKPKQLLWKGGVFLALCIWLNAGTDLEFDVRIAIMFALLAAFVLFCQPTVWKPIFMLVVAMWIALSFYFYMPLSSATNPPMNWGYCRVKEGIYHHITRGQYEAGLAEQIKRYIGPFVMVKPPPPPPQTGTPRSIRKFYGQVNTYFENLSDNFTLILSLLALFVFFYFRDLSQKDRWWIIYQLSLFVFLVPFLIYLLNPEFDKQTQQIQKVFYILSHALYAVWIGYGIMFLMSILAQQKPGDPRLVYAGYAVALLLPLGPVLRNWKDCDQRGHEFGYYFGHDMFLANPKLKAHYPEMDRDAVLYGGTDPGRFVPTFMILVESLAPSRAKYKLDPTFDRSDVYIITQNALADNTYMNYIRDHYALERPDINNPATLTNRSGWQQWVFQFGWNHLGRHRTYPTQPIWIPNQRKVEEGFTQYVNEIRARGTQAGEHVRIEGGKVQIQGVQGVMAINGIISKMIFDANKEKHSFYVEESYVIPWMYPHLEPFAVIMKINKEPLPRLTPDKVTRDRQFWDEYVAMLQADPRFARDTDAQKSFSKLRTAVAGLYTWRGANGQPELNAEAEYAFQQALTLCPDSPETNFRYVELLSRLERYDDAIDVLEKFRKLDPYNAQILKVKENVAQLKRVTEEQSQWEERYKLDPTNLEVCLRLVQVYVQRGRADKLDQVVNNLVQLPAVNSNHLIQIAQLYAQQQRVDRVAVVLEALTRRAPDMVAAWYDLTVVNLVLNRQDAAWNALEQAVKRGGEAVKNQAKQDQRLTPLREHPRYKTIIGE